MGKHSMMMPLAFKSTLLALLLAFAPVTTPAAVVVSETRLTPSPGAPDQEYASDVAINSNTAAVGSLQAFHGTVYIYTLIGTNWVQTQILSTGISTFETFGRAVALDDNVLAVGQPSTLGTNPAAVYIYTNSGGIWSLQQKIVEVNPVVPGSFGSALDISGTDLAVGNPGESSDTNSSGAVYVYTEIGNTWQLQAKLKPNDPANSLLFGNSVAIDGDTVLAGTLRDAAYVFTRTGTNWSQQQKLVAPPLEPSAGFGAQVALEGDVAAITGQQTINGTNNGAVYVFNRTGTTWNLAQILTLPGTETNFVFANSVAIRDGEIVVGLPGRSVDGLDAAGTVAIFQFNGTSWVFAQEVAATDHQAGALLGASVDVGGAGIIAGAPGFEEVGRSGKGAAYIFSSAPTNPPISLVISATPNVLFPPNRKLVPVTISVANHDSFSDCRIVSVTSNEPVNGKGKKSPDWIITGDLTLLLRAERTGGAKAGRIYTITVECRDTLGNTVQTSTTVRVPHDRR
jgi:ethanolamine utilization microcompartment shell protein EutS